MWKITSDLTSFILDVNGKSSKICHVKLKSLLLLSLETLNPLAKVDHLFPVKPPLQIKILQTTPSLQT